MKPWTVTVLDAEENGTAKTITVRYTDEPEDREVQALLIRLNGTWARIGRVA